MSVDGTKLLFEGFLQKRKDKMKLRWVTYWFRLQNTTLFFYTEKNGSASHLRGHYYIYTVQSVREVHRVSSKRFMFEIIMTNGKRKVLAAETAALRKEWVNCLWEAMHLSTAVSDSRRSLIAAREQKERSTSSPPVCSDAVPGSLSGHIHHEVRSLSRSLSEKTQQHNTRPACSVQQPNGDFVNTSRWSTGMREPEVPQVGDYDTLPLRNREREISVMDEGLYDFPVTYKRPAELPDPTEGIYDAPSSLLRQMPEHMLEEQPEDGDYWKI